MTEQQELKREEIIETFDDYDWSYHWKIVEDAMEDALTRCCEICKYSEDCDNQELDISCACPIVRYKEHDEW